MNGIYLREALKATDEYLGVEKRILAGDKSQAALHDFTYWFSRAHDLLDMLGVYEDHKDYMQNHVDIVWKAMQHHDLNLGDEPWVHVPRSDIGEELPESYIQEAKKKDDTFNINRLANGLRWDHIAHTYNEDDFVYAGDDKEKLKEAKNNSDPCWNREVPNCVPVNEGISSTTRMKKSMGMHNRSKSLAYARNLKLKRVSTMEQIKARAHQAARRILMDKMLHGRSKGALSPIERDALEARMKAMRPQVHALSQALVPKIIQLERSRLSKKHK